MRFSKPAIPVNIPTTPTLTIIASVAAHMEGTPDCESDRTAMGQVYQRGSVRRVKRAKGNDVWEWRYRVRGKMKQEKFKVADYPTEKALLRSTWRRQSAC